MAEDKQDAIPAKWIDSWGFNEEVKASNDAVERIIDRLRMVVELLVQRKYVEIDEITGGNSWPAADVAQELEEDKVRLTMPPEDAFRDFHYRSLEGVTEQKVLNEGRECALQIYEGNTFPPSWLVNFDLWTEGGRSDYTLQLTFRQVSDGTISAALESAHVM